MPLIEERIYSYGKVIILHQACHFKEYRKEQNMQKMLGIYLAICITWTSPEDNTPTAAAAKELSCFIFEWNKWMASGLLARRELLSFRAKLLRSFASMHGFHIVTFNTFLSISSKALPVSKPPQGPNWYQHRLSPQRWSNSASHSTWQDWPPTSSQRILFPPFG